MEHKEKLKMMSIIFVIISLLICNCEEESHIIKFLPGYPAILPFTLETGYIGVGKLEEVELFYYFIESERDPAIDPLLLWLTGGPGCSAFSGLVFEIGPLTFNYSASYSSTDTPKFQLNPYSWTKVANIIFLDSPVGTGFSYGTTADAYYSDDILQSQYIYEFLRKWLTRHSKFKANHLYVSGDSYSGKIVPIVVQEILNGNKNKLVPKINIKGYILGNPKTSDDAFTNGRPKYAHRISLISDELYKSARINCRGDFTNVEEANTSNTKCLESFQAMLHLRNVVNEPHVLEPKCVYLSPKPHKMTLTKDYIKQPCRPQLYMLSYEWANDIQVREALHIREGTVDYWVRCNHSLNTYTQNVRSTVDYHEGFKKQFLRALVYSGDQDAAIPYVSTLEWIKQLNLSVDIKWSPWFVDGQVAGYVTQYWSFPYRLTFSTVKGAGHTAPEYKPRESLAMIDRWLGLSPL
ncbi:serine carboxypeptidase-like 13 isoform X1 [Amaranthus tricolor]|uniref:serine carboxypeptidase-like 13 isoform X1 n=1 Tax=Amaranthus tricolor TaxID=29722 RepID=UPI00258D1D18|nr:serine carboxypeptidase-like 13 isoform X1 [Amaranthus tricolor]